jgi:hypothetical protein
MYNIRVIKSSTENSMDSNHVKLDLYRESFSILDPNLKKLTQENKELKRQCFLKDEIIKTLNEKVLEQDFLIKNLKKAKNTSLKPEKKSELMHIIDSFKEKTSANSIQDIKDEFEDIEKIQSEIKQENHELKKSISKFEELYPSIYQITNLTQRLFLAIQSYINGDHVNLNFLVLSHDKPYKKLEVPRRFSEDVIKTKKTLEKIIHTISDYHAEKFGSDECLIS